MISNATLNNIYHTFGTAILNHFRCSDHLGLDLKLISVSQNMPM